jgi:ABC-type dipeptide/oligopeptide/nickel transport system ATPase component
VPLELSSLAEKDWRRIRGKDIAMIFQNPGQALNPSRTVCSQFIEAIRVHRQKTSRQECKQLAETMLEEVMLPDPKRVLNSYP